MIFGLILKLRHLAWDRGCRRTFTASVPTVSIGNVTVGGTGKTPHVEYVLRRLADRYDLSETAVLSLGYGRKTRGYLEVEAGGSALMFGDEPLQIKNKFPEVRVAVCKDRVEGCRRLEKSGARIVVLDDAMQYRRLVPTLSLCLMDYSRPVFSDRLLPFGRLRDLPSRVSGSDLVVVTKCPDGFDPEPFAARYGRVVFSRIRYGAIEPAFGGDAGPSAKMIALTGIACNRPFLEHLRSEGEVVKVMEFPDHHFYTRADIEALGRALEEHPGACIVTTEKDVSRLSCRKKELGALADSIFAVPVEVEFCSASDKAAFDAQLIRVF